MNCDSVLLLRRLPFPGPSSSRSLILIKLVNFERTSDFCSSTKPAAQERSTDQGLDSVSQNFRAIVVPKNRGQRTPSTRKTAMIRLIDILNMRIAIRCCGHFTLSLLTVHEQHMIQSQMSADVDESIVACCASQLSRDFRCLVSVDLSYVWGLETHHCRSQRDNKPA